MAVCRSSLAVFLGFLIIYPGLCSPDKNSWTSICPDTECETVDIASQQKSSVSGVTNKLGIHDKVYCIKTVNPLSIPGLRHLWYRYHIALAPKSDKAVTVVMGNSTQSVKESIEQMSTWTQSKRVTGTRFGTSPYDVLCAGIKVLPDKTLDINGNKFTLFFDRRLQLFFPVALTLGLLLFYLSPYFTKNIHFYYTSGVALGVIASLLILLYIFSRFVPKKNLLGLGVLLGGYSFTGFFIHWIYTQGLTFVQDNLFYLAVYVVVSGMISFAVLYRIGPAHERTMILVKWFLQLLGLCLILLSMQFVPFGLVIVGFILLWNNVPKWLFTFISTIFFFVFFCLKPLRKMFRKRVKKKMLSMEEYEEQGIRETEKALNALRSYCRKAGSDVWDNLDTFKAEGRLKSFLVGEDHVSEREKAQHKHEYDSEQYYDDSDEENDHTPQNWSQLSSGVSSPDPTPPSAPYPPNPAYPNLSRISSTKSDFDKRFHTTYN